VTRRFTSRRKLEVKKKKKREKTYISENVIQAKHFINRKIFTTSAKAP
jgi:hypothetical protein